MVKPLKRRNVTQVHDMLHELLGERVPGGCEYCDAYQTVHLENFGAIVRVHHDSWCPMLRPRSERLA